MRLVLHSASEAKPRPLSNTGGSQNGPTRKELQGNTKQLQEQISRGKELESSLKNTQNQLRTTEETNQKLQQDLLCNKKLLEEAKTQIEKLQHESIENAINYGMISEELMKEFAKDAPFEKDLNFNKKNLNI